MADEAVLEATDIDAGLDAAQDDGNQDYGVQDDASVDDSQDDSVDDESADDSADDAAADDEAAPEGGKEEVAADGRKMPDGLKKGLAALKTINPEAAKIIKGVYYAEQEYRQVFPLPADAVAAKTLIEQVGGHEGIQQMETEREEWNALDKSYSEGSQDFVKSIAESNPEAFLKTATHVVNEWASRAPDQYQYYANTVSLNTLASAGLSIDNLARAYNGYADNPQAQGIIAEIHNSLVGLKEKTNQYEQKRTDPREEQLKQRETQFEQKRRADFEGGVADKAESFLKEKMQPEIDRVVAGRKVDPDAMKGYQKMVDDEVKRMLSEIPGFSDKLDAHYRTGDSSKSLTYITSQYNRILPIAAKVIEPFLRNIGPGTKAPVKAATGQPGRASSPGEIVLKEMPDHSQIDFNKCTVADVMQGNAVLKNGKKASGWG